MIGRLKRWLRPLRPVLLPVWRPIRPYVVRVEQSQRRGAMRLAAVRRRMEARRGRVRPLSANELTDLAATIPYYKKRMQYMTAASRQVAEIASRHRLRRAIELGPHLRPLLVGADVLVLGRIDGLEAEGKVIVHDARQTPWPFADGAYDLFVALQVFEHLGDRQPEAFREVCRVARHAIISLPIDWVMADPANCHHQISQERALSWFAPRIPTKVVEGNPGPRRRMIYVFENLDRTT